MKTLNFNVAYTYISAKYGLTMDQNEFTTVGMIAYTKIGNRNTEVKVFQMKLCDDKFDMYFEQC